MKKKHAYKLSGVILFVPGIYLVAISKILIIGFIILLIAGFLLLEGSPVMKHIKRKSK